MISKALYSALAVAFVTTMSVAAQAQTSRATTYDQLYGEGLRDYAEGHYDSALDNLYRAWVLEPSEFLLKLIVRCHDFIGHCSAATRQRELLSELYPNARLPTPQRCETPGTLELACGAYSGEVRVNDAFDIRCESSTELGPGRYTLRIPRSNDSQNVEIRPGASLRVDLEITPEKWVRSSRARPTGSEEILIETPDGKYQLWLRSNLRRDPDMERESPGFTILRTTDGLYDISSSALKPLEDQDSDDNPTRKVDPAPRIPSLSP